MRGHPGGGETPRKGKMTARERIDYLLDDGSFQELDMLARIAPRHGPGGEPALHRRGHHRLRHHRGSPGLRLQSGLHRLRRCPREVFAEKIHKVMDLASSIACR